MDWTKTICDPLKRRGENMKIAMCICFLSLLFRPKKSYRAKKKLIVSFSGMFY
jgi:hypothetical protein